MAGPRRTREQVPTGAEHLAVLTMDEVAALLRCSRQHVYTLHQREGLPITRLGGFTVVRVGELDRWLAEHTESYTRSA
jgi:excisionase family DNA binding protein